MKKAVIKVEPIFLEKVWGKKINNKNIGEIILFSVKLDLSNVTSSQRSLYELYINKKERICSFGLKYFFKKKFPFLLKIIIADDNLSIQVHPKGKNEYWIVRAKGESKILLSTKDFADVKSISVRKNDYYFLPGGVTHSILKNNNIFEISNPDNVTYRLFDWNRNRKMNIEEGLRIANGNKKRWKKIEKVRMIKTSQFKLKRLYIKKVSVKTFLNCKIIFINDGFCIVKDQLNNKINLKKNDCILIPMLSKVCISGIAELFILE